MLRLPEMPAVQYDTVALSGGFDQTTSAYQLPAGALRDCINFACKPQGGYYRIPGYERFDGRPSPSDGEFVTVEVTLNPGEVLAIGDVGVFGSFSGTVCFIDPAFRFYGLTKMNDTWHTPFVAGPINIGAGAIGTADALFTALTPKEVLVIRAAAADIYRADIEPVPGSGPIRGVFFHEDTAYAFRDSDLATACLLYESGVSGWTEVALPKIVNFTLMAVLPAEGSTLTQGGVTAVVKRVAVTSGDLTGGTAAGYIALSAVAGGSFIAGVATYPGGSATLAGAESQLVLLPGGTYSFSTGTFTTESRIYGADGLNDAFEFDGETYFPIPLESGLKPKYALPHTLHLFLAVGTSIIHSGLGEPYNFEVINGAGEISCYGTITNLLEMTGNQSTSALLVTTRNSTSVLYGTSAADWNLSHYNLGIGAWDRTTQNLFNAFGMDDRGVTTIAQSLNYGNFDSATLTYNIQRFINEQLGKVTCSGLSRSNGQYRAYFNDGRGLYVTMSPQGFVGHGTVEFPEAVLCNYDAERSDGRAISLFGTGSGYVMQNDVGTSFDGSNIVAYMNTNINCAKSPRLRKRFRRCVIEVQGEYPVEMQVGYSFEWASSLILPHGFVDAQLLLLALSRWDSMVWDAFFWDGKTDEAIHVELNGTGENLQLAVVVNNNFIEEFTLPSVIFHFTPRRGNR